MYYEINVSLNGKHYFATSSRSLQTKNQAIKMAEHFEKLFTKEEGYKVEITEWHTMGTSYSLGELKGDN